MCMLAYMRVYMCVGLCVINIVSILYFCWSADTNCGGGGSGTNELQPPEQVASVGRIYSDQRPGNASTSDKEKFSNVDDSELSRLLK